MISRTAPGELLGNTIHASYIPQIHATSTSIHFDISGETNNDNIKRDDRSFSCFFCVQWSYSKSLNHALPRIGLLAAIACRVVLPLIVLTNPTLSAPRPPPQDNFTRACSGMRFNFSISPLASPYRFVLMPHASVSQ